MIVEVDWRSRLVEVVVADTNETAEATAQSICEELGEVFIGMDTEWGKAGNVAVLQLASSSTCLICLLPEVDLQACKSILSILAESRFIKVGVAVTLDAQLLREQFGVQLHGCLDLSLLAAREGAVSAAQPVGLAALTQLLLDVELAKDSAIRRSNWSERPLTPTQLEYAARDALAGKDCAAALAAKYQPARTSVLDWCAELLDREAKQKRAPKTAAEDSSGKRACSSRSGGALDCGAYSCVTKFGLRPILSSTGEPLLHMKERTVEGLLRRGLASICMEGDIETVRLHFTPTDHYEYAGLDAAERNACVGCGAHGVARFYIIPRLFFMYLPEKCKSYNCHDVVMVCPKCRAKAEPAQTALTQDLLAKHGAVKAGAFYANENALSPEEVSAKKAAAVLRRPQRKGKVLPPEKAAALREAVAAGLGLDPSDLTDEHLALAEGLGGGSLPSERIVAAATETPEGLRAFLRRWREAFVQSLQPQYLAEGWSLDTGLDGRFVPSVASSLEWPGDWRCPACGVHCFGRSASCRNCKRLRDADAGEEELQSQAQSDCT
mmetsp:Transcript_70510/g.168891  ORF Transcript_70510/g.168891 Transcript_70510/m.168891 type:complete len:552 (+) Transcript_70510:54-1709(+)